MADLGGGGYVPPPDDAGRAIEAGIIPDTCVNNSKDGSETDVDCGGTVCGKCIDGKACISNTDCAGDNCLAGKCATPRCTNNATDGDETDTDCGGAFCPKCVIGKRCTAPGDCVTGACSNNYCRCPKGMTERPRAGGGGAYCIDEIEVTKSQYDYFLKAGVSVDLQEPVCKTVNTQFAPRNGWPLRIEPPSFPQEPNVGAAFNLSLPVHYVDWCDAYAYCKWAKKQLCGRVTGGAADYSKPNDANEDAWFNACSSQGAYAYLYGPDFIAGKCNGGVAAEAGDDDKCGPVARQRSNYGCRENKDDGIHAVIAGDINGAYSTILHAECAGGVTGPFHMLGNVAEWEDSCDSTQPDAKCRVRGGSYADGNDDSVALSCAGERTEQRVPPVPNSGPDPLADIGFRCCVY